MLEFTTTFRVRYGETDQSSFVFNGNYSAFYEIGRTEAIRSMGISYKEIEERGIVMPLIYQNSQFHYPAFYDELISIKTKIKEMPKARIIFYYELFNESGRKIHSGENALAFIDKQTHRPKRTPEWFINILQKEMEKQSK